LRTLREMLYDAPSAFRWIPQVAGIDWAPN
jgi:hypothetical protein